MKSREILVAVTVLAPAATFASWTALVAMPIADILGHREATYGYGLGGTESHISKAIDHAHTFEFGAFDKIEFGFDNDLNGGTTLNAKLLLFEEPEEARYALSVGVGDFVNGTGTTYFTARHDFKGFRLHAALLHDDTDHFAIGIDSPLFGDGVWTIEYMSGPGAATWGGLFIPIKAVPGLELDLAIGMPANRDEGLQYAAGFIYGWSF